MPAAAVIPAPVAYIKVVAVKKLVVGRLAWWPGPPSAFEPRLRGFWPPAMLACEGGTLRGGWSRAFTSSDPHLPTPRRPFTLKKIECLKQALSLLNMLAWNNKIGLWFYFVGSWKTKVMIDRDSWGC